MIALKLSRREILSNKKYWLFFAVNLCIGLLGFTFIYLLRAQVTDTLESRAKQLLTADLAISSRRALTEDELSKIKETLKDNISKEAHLTELYSMGKAKDKSRLMLVKALGAGYPLLGSIELEKNRVLDETIYKKLQSLPLAIISKEIAYQFNLKVGDDLRIGEQIFSVFDVISSDSTSSLRGVNLAPKVFISEDHLAKTKLINSGTLAFKSYYYLFHDEANTEVLKEELQAVITDPAVSIQSAENSSEQLGRVVNYITNFLGLIGVVALLLSCIGASYLFQSYLFDRIKQIGIMRSLGVRRVDIMWSFVIIITLFGVIATIFAVTLSSMLLPIVIGQFKEYLNFEISQGSTWEIYLILLSIGVLVNLLVCLPIVVRVFKTNISSLLDGEIDESLSYRDRALYIPSILFIWIISVWQSNSLIIGSLFFGAIVAVSAFVLFVLPILLSMSSTLLSGRRITWPLSLSIGYGSRVVSRNRTTTLLTVLCLCVGACLINVIGQIDHSLKQELGGDTSKKPSLFLFDIQEEQIDDFEKFTSEKNIPIVNLSPMVRARLIKKNGEQVKRMTSDSEFETNESKRKRRFNNRGVNLTYAPGLNDTETLVEGVEFSNTSNSSGIAQISLEKRYADRLEVGLGDTLTYEILGIEMQGKVTNIRTVRWTSFIPNFFIKFQPGFLEEAPKTYLSAIGNVSFERQLEIQNQIVERFSNISIVNVTDLISKMITLFSAMAVAVGLMSFCCIGVGIFVLYSILQSQMHKKSNEFALQKIIGMTKSQIFKTLFAEYSILVATSIIIGLIFGILVSKVVSIMFLDGNFTLDYNFMIYFAVGLFIVAGTVVTITFNTFYKKNVSQLLD